jgi:Mce-associated membrane protein
LRVTSELRPREDEATAPADPDGRDTGAPPEAAGPGDTHTPAPASEAGDAATAGRRRRARRGSGDDGGRTRSRLSLPLIPTLLLLLALLVGATAYLWFTRPDASAVRTGDYVEALQAARSGVVDMTSFDHLTLDDDIEQIRRVSTGELREEAVDELDASRQQITDAQAVVNTEVVGGGVTKAGSSAATVWLVIQSTQESNQSEQAQVARYRIEVELEKPDGRWLLSGIKGTGTENE